MIARSPEEQARKPGSHVEPARSGLHHPAYLTSHSQEPETAIHVLLREGLGAAQPSIVVDLICIHFEVDKHVRARAHTHTHTHKDSLMWKVLLPCQHCPRI